MHQRLGSSDGEPGGLRLWVSAAASTLRSALRRAAAPGAVAAGAACVSSGGVRLQPGRTVRVPSYRFGRPAVMQETAGHEAKAAPSEVWDESRNSWSGASGVGDTPGGARDGESEGATDAATTSAVSPKLHFCESTNEPEDTCNAQWLLLWSYAAYAPEYPSEQEKALLRDFYTCFPDQCTEGPAAFCYSDALKTNPPRLDSRRDLMLWLCTVENQCRMKVGMPVRRCRLNDLLRRWRYADAYL